MRQRNSRGNIMRGGLRNSIRDSDFKYTTSEKRKVWTKAVYPLRKHLLQMLGKIPFADYEYKGDTYVVKELETAPKSQTDDIFELNGILYRKNANPVEMKTQKPGITWTIFGGSAYELLNDIYPNVDLYEFMDPTGDIDVQAYNQEWKIIDDHNHHKEAYMRLLLNNFDPSIPGGLNPYYRNQLAWMHAQICDQLERMQIETLLPLIIPNATTFDISEYNRTAFENTKYATKECGYNHASFCQGKLQVISFAEFSKTTNEISSEMLKVQIVLGVKGRQHTIMDHILEIVFLTNSTQTGNFMVLDFTRKRYTKKSTKRTLRSSNNLHGKYLINSIPELLSKNIEAYKNTHQLILFDSLGDSYLHKGLNFISRFLYLLDLLKHNPIQISKADNITMAYLFSRQLNSLLASQKQGYLKYYMSGKRPKEVQIPIEMILYAYSDVFGRYKQPNVMSHINSMLADLYKKGVMSLNKLETRDDVLINREYFELMSIIHGNNKNKQSRKTSKHARSVRSLVNTNKEL
jgi:hypothetical protein